MSQPIASEAQVRLLPIFDRAFKADPHPLYVDMRRKEGVTAVRLPSGYNAWLVTDYELARRVLSDPRFAKRSPETDPTSTHPLFKHLLASDPPRHTELRNILAPHFTTRHLHKLAPMIKLKAQELVAQVEPGSPFDLLSEFARPLAFASIAYLIGFDNDLTDPIEKLLDQLDKAEFEGAGTIPLLADKLQNLLLRHADAFVAHPPSETASSLCEALLEAHRSGVLYREDIAAQLFVLLAAGRETTANLICNGALRMLATAGTTERLRAVPHEIEHFVEEVLRLDSPLEVATARYASESATIGEVTVGAGQTVFVALAAANRDPRTFPCPDEMRSADMPPARHVSFGHGIHRCIGASFARLQAATAFRVLLDRDEIMQLACSFEAIAWKPGLISRGLEVLPVTFNARSHEASGGPRR